MSLLKYSDHLLDETTPNQSLHHCKKCSYFTTSNLKMKNHMKCHDAPQRLFDCVNSIPEMYLCKDCNFRTSLIVCLKNHVTDWHTFVRKTAKTSPKAEKKVQNYICRKCKFQTQFLLQWLKHLGCCRDNDKNKLDDKKTVFSCEYCPYSSTRRPTLEIHKILKHLTDEEIKWYKCDECSFKTKTKYYINKHKDQHLQICKICFKRFQLKEELDDHVKNLHLQMSFLCEKCAFLAGSATELQNHVQKKHLHTDSHQTEKSTCIRCRICSYKAKDQSELNSHKRKLHTEKRFQCEHCPYKSYLKQALLTHVIAKHTKPNEIKWFRCNECDYKAKVKLSLNIHILSKHTRDEDINWFRCELCPYKGKRKYDLKSHLMYRHAESHSVKWFECDECCTGNGLKNCLKENKIYQCGECPFIARMKANMIQHKKQEHQIDGI